MLIVEKTLRLLSVSIRVKVKKFNISVGNIKKKIMSYLTFGINSIYAIQHK